MVRAAACFALCTAALSPALAAAGGKVPATVNIGFGPTVGTVWMPGNTGPTPISVGVALRAEGWVSKKTLHSKKVMRRVPRKYKGMVKSMDDLHVVPLPVGLIPDQAMVAPVNKDTADATLRAVGWTPVSIYLAHKVKPSHRVIGAAPRIGWVQTDLTPDDDNAPANHLYLGLDLAPEFETAMKKKVGVAVGGNMGPGIVTNSPFAGDDGATFGVWVDGFVRLHVRKPIKVKI